MPRIKEFGLLGVIVALGLALTLFGGSVTLKQRDPASGKVVGEIRVNKFLQAANLDNILKSASWTAVMAVGATILIIAGGIDLSIGAIYCLAAVSGAMFLRWAGPGGSGSTASVLWTVPVGVAVTLGVGALAGSFNGAMVTLLKVHPFIITLGTMSIFRGIAFVTTEAQAITDFPPSFGSLIRSTVAGMTVFPIVVVILVVLAGDVFLRSTVAGRYTYALGGNETAARYSGIRVERIKLVAYVLAGLCGGIAAVITLGIFGSADSSTGRGYELDVIAAAVVGGASLSGGKGTAVGAVLGALVIQLIANGIVILQIDQNYTEIIKGAVIVLAVVLDRLGRPESVR